MFFPKTKKTQGRGGGRGACRAWVGPPFFPPPLPLGHIISVVRAAAGVGVCVGAREGRRPCL